MLIIIFSLFLFNVSAQDNTWTLKECIDYAIENNLALKRVKLSLNGTEVDLKQSKFDLLPNVNANSSYGYNWGRSIDPTSNQFITQRINFASVGASASATLFSGGRQLNYIRQSEHNQHAAKFDYQAAINNLMFNVIALYTNVIFNQELLENAKKQLENTKQQLVRIKKQVEVGALPTSDRLDLEAQSATNELNLIQQENALNLSILHLKQALQLPTEVDFNVVVPEELDINIEAEPVLDYSASEIYEQAVQNLPEIKGAREQIESAELGVKIARGGLYPSINANTGLSSNYSDAFRRFTRDGTFTTELVPGLQTENGFGIIQMVPNGQLTDVTFSDQMSENLSKYLSFGLSVPVFNGWSTRANIQRSIINQEQAEINLQETKNSIRQDIETAYNDVIAAAKSYVAARKQVQAREEAYRMTEKRFNLGATSFIDFQIAENQLFQANSDLVRAKYDYIYKLKILDFYLGNPLGF